MMVDISISSPTSLLDWLTAIGILFAAAGGVWAAVAGSRSARHAARAAGAATELAKHDAERREEERQDRATRMRSDLVAIRRNAELGSDLYWTVENQGSGRARNVEVAVIRADGEWFKHEFVGITGQSIVEVTSNHFLVNYKPGDGSPSPPHGPPAADFVRIHIRWTTEDRQTEWHVFDARTGRHGTATIRVASSDPDS